MFDINMENLEHFKKKSESFLKSPIIINATTAQLPQVALPNDNANNNSQVRHLFIYMDQSHHNNISLFNNAQEAMGQEANATGLTRLHEIRRNLNEIVNFYAPKGFIYFLTRKQRTAALFAAAAHVENITLIQLEPVGFRLIEDILDEKQRVQTVLSRIQNQLRLRGNGLQLRQDVNIDANQPIQLQNLN